MRPNFIPALHRVLRGMWRHTRNTLRRRQAPEPGNPALPPQVRRVIKSATSPSRTVRRHQGRLRDLPGTQCSRAGHAMNAWTPCDILLTVVSFAHRILLVHHMTLDYSRASWLKNCQNPVARRWPMLAAIVQGDFSTVQVRLQLLFFFRRKQPERPQAGNRALGCAWLASS